jgi:two-component system phosphate regulon sensor histidine kinase PhoR
VPAGETILVVDDEKVIRDGCSRILAPEGYRVLGAIHGQDALEVMARERVDVVLCDLKMPVMGAVELLEAVGAKYPEVPVIIITGHGTVESAVECMRKGAYDFITKPFRADHLAIIVQRALEKQALERQAQQLQEERARHLYDLAMEQSRIRTIVNFMADGVLVTNRDLEVVLHNPALVRLLQLPLRLAQLGSLSHYIKEESLVTVLRELVEGGGAGRELISQEIVIGKTHLRTLSAPVCGADRDVLGTVTVFQDVTHFKERDEMKSNFVRLVSHELRAPLAAIQQQHSVILDGLAGGLTDKQKELLGRAREKIDGLLDLINDLLDVARIESGHAVQQQVPLQLEAILAGTMRLMRAKAQALGVTLKLLLPPELPEVLADVRGMEEVFTNLISNAIKYSPDGGEVTVSAEIQGDFLEVRVTDKGIGIEPEEIPKIFEPFYRVKHPKTRHVIGTGLGLPIVKGIVEAHRGSVTVESTPGRGSTFKVVLPTLADIPDGDPFLP